MKKCLFAVLIAGSVALLGSQAQAHDRCDDDNYRYQSYRYRDSVRYEYPRYYSYEEVRPRRVIVEDDYRPHYRYHRNNLFSVFFGGF